MTTCFEKVPVPYKKDLNQSTKTLVISQPKKLLPSSGFVIRDQEKSYFQVPDPTQIQGSKQHRIPDLQHLMFQCGGSASLWCGSEFDLSPDADPDFYLMQMRIRMRIQVIKMMRIRIRFRIRIHNTSCLGRLSPDDRWQWRARSKPAVSVWISPTPSRSGTTTGEFPSIWWPTSSAGPFSLSFFSWCASPPSATWGARQGFGSGFNQVRIRIRKSDPGGQKWPSKVGTKLRSFYVLKWWMFFFWGLKASFVTWTSFMEACRDR